MTFFLRGGQTGEHYQDGQARWKHELSDPTMRPSFAQAFGFEVA